jgi:hypothetical protein
MARSISEFFGEKNNERLCLILPVGLRPAPRGLRLQLSIEFQPPMEKYWLYSLILWQQPQRRQLLFHIHHLKLFAGSCSF